MGTDRLGDPGPAGDPAHDPSRPVTVETPTVAGDEDRPGGTFADGQVDRPCGPQRRRDGHGLAALAQHGESPMASLHTKRLDVRPDRLCYPQPVEGQQRAPGMLTGRAEPCGDEERTDLVAVQADGVRFEVDPRAADMDRRGVCDQPSSSA